MNNTKNLVLFIVSFGAFMLLVLTRLEYVLAYGTVYQVRDPLSSPFKPKMIEHPAQADAQFLGVLMVLLAVGSVFFLIRLLKK